MSTTPEINAEIVNQLASQPDRFVLTGSLARGVLLGHDVADLNDPRANRFQDVDVIDRTAYLSDEYNYLTGHLGAGVTKVVRPVPNQEGTWGFYDNLEPVDPSTTPVSTFEESELRLEQRPFSRLYPNKAVTIPSPRAMLYLSNFFAYAQNMPKHQKQIAAIEEIAGPPAPELDEAYHDFISKMLERYPLNKYTRARKVFFDRAPRIAFAAQQSLVGPIIRQIRGISAQNLKPLADIVPELPDKLA